MHAPFRLLPIFLVTSCTPLSRDPLNSVRAQIRDRIGHDVTLPTNADDATTVAAQVNALVKRPLTPDSAMRIALMNNRRLRATLEEVGISQAELVEAGTARNPSLASSVRFPDGGGGSNREFSIAADVLDLLLIPMKRRIAADELVQTERRVSHEILQLAAETKTAYFTLVASEQQLRKLRDIAGVNESISDFAKRVHDAGNISDLEKMELQVGYQQMQADLKHARVEVESHRAELNRHLGLGGSQARWTLALSELPPLPPSDPSLAKAEAAALAQRQDLAAAMAHVASLESALVLKRKTRLMPGLNLGVNTEREPDGGRLTGPTLDLELPLFNRGRASVSKLEATLRQARAEAEAIEAEVRNDVAASHTAMRLAREAANYQRVTLLPMRQGIFKETLLHYNAMQKSNIALLRAKDEEQRAEKDAIESLRDYWLARTALEKAAGGSVSGKAGGKSATTAPDARAPTSAPKTRKAHE